MAFHLVEHPLLAHKIGLLREQNTSHKSFRELACELALLLTYEATRNLKTQVVSADCWSGPTDVARLDGSKITVVPVLRAGLGMLDGVMQLIPNARVSMLGMRRDEETLQAHAYLERLAGGLPDMTALMVDPMLATGGSAVAALSRLKEAGCRDIRCMFLLAAPEGVETLMQAHPDVEIYCSALDQRLNEQGFILPGLGDAGDRLFGTIN